MTQRPTPPTQAKPNHPTAEEIAQRVAEIRATEDVFELPRMSEAEIVARTVDERGGGGE